MRATHIFHCDWGSTAPKRWLGKAILDGDHYNATAAVPVHDNVAQLIPSILENVGSQNCALVGFDFPIGIPAKYAHMIGVKNFRSFLEQLGSGPWIDFCKCASESSEISLYRPFYPFRPGGTKQSHLTKALDVENMDELRRQCETRQGGRTSPCCLFWTLGPNQVGKAAIIGWRDVLAPILKKEKNVLLWPFDGELDDLLQPGKVVIVETYPAEYYRWFAADGLIGKGNIQRRKEFGPSLLNWADEKNITLTPALCQQIENGFREGDDALDALVGLFAMIEVTSGSRSPGQPPDERTKNVEGWILGRAGSLSR